MDYENPAQLERGVIGALLLNNDRFQIPEVRGLHPDQMRHFGGLWAITREGLEAGRDVGLIELSMAMSDPRWPVGMTVQDLIDMEALALDDAELPGAVRAILAAYRRENGHRIASKLAAGLQAGGEPTELLAEAQSGLTGLLSGDVRDSTVSISENLDAAVNRMRNPQLRRGVPTGLVDLDRLTGGWHRGMLHILAARPSMGKSALVAQVCEHAAREGYRTLLFSFEDGAEMTRMRTMSRLSGVVMDYERSALSPREQKQVDAAAAKLRALDGRWLIDDEASSLDSLIAACWRAKQRGGLDLVVIDQLSHITVSRAPRGMADNRTQLYGYITKTLKHEIAKRLGVPVVLCSQLSREVTKRANPAPQLSDLRDSGEIEQDADVVIFIHRPEYYDTTDRPNEADLIVAKQRQGKKDVTATVITNMATFRFRNMQKEHYE